MRLESENRDNISTYKEDRGKGEGLILECETEELSDAQVFRIQKLKDEVSRLQNLIKNNGTPVQKTNDFTLPLLVNGTNGTPVNSSLSNGPNMVGVQVPQFLLLQNGQMIATGNAIQPTSNSATSYPATTNQSSLNTITFKSNSARSSSSSHLTQAFQRPLQKKSGKNSNSASTTPAVNNSGDAPEIQVLSEMRGTPTQGSSSSRTLRELRIQSQSGSPATVSSISTSTTSTTTFKPISSLISDNSGINGITIVSSASTTSTVSPAIRASVAPSSTVTTPAAAAGAAAAATSSQLNAFVKFPLLNITARPRNTLPPAAAMAQRKDLDTKVKLVLVKSPQEFVEWLLSEGLIRSSQNCSLHLTSTQQPYKLKLGMFSDPKALATSGGYVWISECCGKKYISVYSGSIFGSTPIDKVPPTSVLKLIYHWSCQTSIVNVENWVKVDKSFINKMFQYLRCVCSVMLQDKVYDFGFDGTIVELGIVSLGTSTADGTKKAVKVEILGLFDRKMKSYRLFASEPEPGSSSRQRFVRILKPLEHVVHPNAVILCDQSVDRNCLYAMNYSKVNVCETNDNEDNPTFNARIMSYLRKHVPKMFQSALSQLDLQHVQLVLDELCWRERFGHCAAHAYSNLIEHIVYLTARESENPGVLHLLDYVAQSPQHNWRYKSQFLPLGPASLHPSIILNTINNNIPISPQVSHDAGNAAQTPLDHSNKVLFTPRRAQVTPSAPEPRPPAPKKLPLPPLTPLVSLASKSDSTELEPFYYGQIQGDPKLGRENCNIKFTCHICSTTCEDNIDFYAHLKLHVTRTPSYVESQVCCDYCAAHFTTEEKKIFHQRVRHMHMDARSLWCRICSEGFSNEYNLVNHMAKKHIESEMPYRCEVCNFMTSIFYSLIDHFNKEHKSTSYVQCHFCLAVKSISPSSSSSFSQRMYQHLQRHMHQQTKCKHCQLNFYSVYLRDEHKKKDHISRLGFPGLQRYKIPAGQKTRIMFRPSIKKNPSPAKPAPAPAESTPLKAMSSTMERNEFKFDFPNIEDYKCMECQDKFSILNHFTSYVKCTRCNYHTSCRSMIAKHSELFHPQLRSKKPSYKISSPIILSKPLYCICGFNSRSGNHLARHLAKCEGGRKSAYPSVSAAMVYHGDVTGGMLNLSLDKIGLSNILPDVEIPSTSIDMSHFMSVSMEVD